ncbi:MAG: ATPase domain-containing protein [Nitrososphaerales archaeon]
MVVVISAGCSALDNLLGGGVRLGMLTDIFGAAGTGKTQICFQLCVNCAKPKNRKGLGASVLFIDATNTFRPERVSQMAEYAGLDGGGGDNNKILDKIYVSRVYNTKEEMAAIKRMPQIRDLKLVIIDSIGDLFALEYKESMGAEKHLRFMRFLHELALYAINSNIAIVVTNGVRFSGGEQAVQHLDRSVSTYVHFKIQLAKQDGVFRALLLQPSLQPREAFFKVADKGIEDV